MADVQLCLSSVRSRPEAVGHDRRLTRRLPGCLCRSACATGVRQRHGVSGSMRCMTLALIVEQTAVQRRVTARTTVGVTVGVTVARGEAAVRAKARPMGARWDEPSRLWGMTMRTARLLDVTDRIQQTWL